MRNFSLEILDNPKKRQKILKATEPAFLEAFRDYLRKRQDGPIGYSLFRLEDFTSNGLRPFEAAAIELKRLFPLQSVHKKLKLEANANFFPILITTYALPHLIETGLMAVIIDKGGAEGNSFAIRDANESIRDFQRRVDSLKIAAATIPNNLTLIAQEILFGPAGGQILDAKEIKSSLTEQLLKWNSLKDTNVQGFSPKQLEKSMLENNYLIYRELNLSQKIGRYYFKKGQETIFEFNSRVEDSWNEFKAIKQKSFRDSLIQNELSRSPEYRELMLERESLPHFGSDVRRRRARRRRREIDVSIDVLKKQAEKKLGSGIDELLDSGSALLL